MAAKRKSTKAPGSRLFDELAQAPPKPLYAIDGEERLMVDEAVRALKKVSVPARAADFNYDAWSAKEVAVSRIVEAAQTLPAFAERRMVLVTQAEAIDTEAAEELVRYVDLPSPTTVLVLVGSAKLDARTRLYKALQKVDATYRFERPRLDQMPAALQARAQALGVRIEPAAVRMLVDAVGNDLSAGSQALEVMSLYVGPDTDRAITADDVAKVVSVTKEENIFELVDAIGRKDKAGALEGLHAMLSTAQAHPLQILALVARHYRSLMKVRAAQTMGLPESDLARLCGVPPFVVGKLKRQGRGYSGAQLAHNLGAVAAADRALKGGALAPARVMERLVLDLMGR